VISRKIFAVFCFAIFVNKPRVARPDPLSLFLKVYNQNKSPIFGIFSKHRIHLNEFMTIYLNLELSVHDSNLEKNPVISARHGLNGTNNNAAQNDRDTDELINNDTRMIANAGQVAMSPTIPAVPASPAGILPQPSLWPSSKNVSILSPGIPLDDILMDNGKKNGKKKSNNKKNGKKDKDNKEDKVPLGPYPVVSPGTFFLKQAHPREFHLIFLSA